MRRPGYLLTGLLALVLVVPFVVTQPGCVEYRVKQSQQKPARDEHIVLPQPSPDHYWEAGYWAGRPGYWEWVPGEWKVRREPVRR